MKKTIITMSDLLTAVKRVEQLERAKYLLALQLAPALRPYYTGSSEDSSSKMLARLSDFTQYFPGSNGAVSAPKVKEYLNITDRLTKDPLVIFRPLLFSGDAFINKYTEMCILRGDPQKITPKEVYSLDNFEHLLRMSYGIHSVRGGWLTNDNKLYSLKDHPIYKLRQDLYLTTGISKLYPYGYFLQGKTIVLNSTYLPDVSRLKFLYEKIGNLEIIQIRTTKKCINNIMLTATPADIMTHFKNEGVRVISRTSIWGKMLKEGVKAMVDTFYYELPKASIEHEPVVTEENKYLLCDDDIYISDRKLDLLIQFHQVLYSDEEYDDIITVNCDENNEYTFVIELDKLLTKDLKVSKKELITWLKELKSNEDDVIIRKSRGASQEASLS